MGIEGQEFFGTIGAGEAEREIALQIQRNTNGTCFQAPELQKTRLQQRAAFRREAESGGKARGQGRQQGILRNGRGGGGRLRRLRGGIR